VIRYRFLLLLTTMWLLPCISHAQTGVYGAFTGAGLGVGSNVYGGTVGLYSDVFHAVVVSAGFDVRGEFLTRNGQSFDGGLAGVRIAVHPQVLPLKPYIEGLGGIARSDTGVGTSTDPQYRILGGVDWTILPRTDWRVVEVSGGSTTGNVNPMVFSTGIVLRLP